jgi:hypothetical protein
MNTDFIECLECHTLKPFTHFNIIKKTSEEKEVQAIINTCYECDLKNIINSAYKPEYLVDEDFKKLQYVLLNTHFKYLNEIQMLVNIFKRINQEEKILSTKLGLLPFSIYKINLFLQSKEKDKIIHLTEEYLNNIKGDISNDIMNVITRSLHKIDNFENRVKDCLTCERDDDSVKVCDSCKNIYKQGLQI